MIDSFYNTTAIYEKYASSIDDIGQEIKTWVVSTYIIGTLQGRSGDRGIIDFQEKATKAERFYCNIINIASTGRLAFSTSAFSYLGSVTTSSSMTSTEIGAMYFITSAFSTYTAEQYARFDGSDYVVNEMKYKDVLYVNDNLRGNHIQIDLKVDYEDRS